MVATVYSWVAPVFFKVIAITIETKAFLMQSRKEMKKKQVRSQHFMLRAIASHIWCEIFLVLEAIFHACEGTIGRNGPEIAEKLVELKEEPCDGPTGGSLVLWLPLETVKDGWLCLPGKAWCEDVKLVKVCVCTQFLHVSMYVISIYVIALSLST